MQLASLKMTKPSARELKISAAVLSVGGLLLLGALWFTHGTSSPVSHIAALTDKNVAIAESAPITPAKAKPHELIKQGNPFSSLTAATPKIGALPPMPSIPVNLAAAPSTPMNKPNVDAATGRKGLHVTSIFTGRSGSNIAVISDGKTQVTAREGKDNKFGYVSEITREGVTIDGRFIERHMDALGPQEGVVVASTVPMPPNPVAAPAPIEPVETPAVKSHGTGTNVVKTGVNK